MGAVAAPRRVLVLMAAMSLLFSLLAVARPVSATEGEDHKTTICHRTNSETNPYVIITVDNAAIDDAGGNSDHMHHVGDNIVWYPGAKTEDHLKWGDIIPPVAGVTPGLNWTDGEGIWNNGCKAGGGDAECIPASSFTASELKELLLDAGSGVDGGHDQNGSTATTWPAIIEVPAELCDVEVSFSSYSLPGGMMQPFDEQVLFDNVTGTYVGGSSNPVARSLRRSTKHSAIPAKSCSTGPPTRSRVAARSKSPATPM